MTMTMELTNDIESKLFIDFFFNDTATTEIYTLSLHDALPIWTTGPPSSSTHSRRRSVSSARLSRAVSPEDRKSTRLNSSHVRISYAVFCLKKKKKKRSDSCLIVKKIKYYEY